MHDYLDQHPDIWMSSVKEPRFLSTDIEDHIRSRVIDASQYFGLFEGGREARYRGESSVYYLYSDVACRRIGELSNDPRIIIMIRNPVDFIQSIHGQFCYSLNETEWDITKALELERERAAGRHIPPEAHTPLGLQYRKMAHFADRIEHYFKAFGRDRVHVIVFDDLKNDSMATFHRLLDFLQLPRIDPSIEAKNRATDRPSKNIVSGRLIKRLPGGYWLAKRVPKPLFVTVRWMLDRIFGRSDMSTQAMPAALRAQLTEEFRDEVERLGELIGRDLSHWSKLD